MSNPPEFRRPPRGLVALLGGAVVVAIVAFGIASGTLDLGVGGTPQVRIEAPAQ